MEYMNMPASNYVPGFAAGQVISPPEPRSAAGELQGRVQQVEAIHKMISELEGRLCGVLRPSGPETSGTGSGVAAPSSGSPLVLDLRSLGYRLDAISARLSDIIARAEV